MSRFRATSAFEAGTIRKSCGFWCAVTLLLAACSDGAGPEGGFGSVEVVTGLEGPGTDPDGLRVLLDGQREATVGPIDLVRFDDVPAGMHTILLDGFSPNCRTLDENPAAVSVRADDVARTGFLIFCSEPVGFIRVTTRTSGTDLDPDGYAVTLTVLADTQFIGVNDERGWDFLPMGAYEVELLGIHSNCVLEGEAGRQATVAIHDTAFIAYELTCVTTPTPPPSGRLTFDAEPDYPLTNREVYLVNADGTGLTRLTDHPHYDGEPALSPDGSRVLFVSNRETLEPRLFVIGVDGSGLAELPITVPDPRRPAWSPDGSRVAFAGQLPRQRGAAYLCRQPGRHRRRPADERSARER